MRAATGFPPAVFCCRLGLSNANGGTSKVELHTSRLAKKEEAPLTKSTQVVLWSLRLFLGTMTPILLGFSYTLHHQTGRTFN